MTRSEQPSANDASGSGADGALRTWRAFDNRLSPIIGPRGFSALYQRSLQRARLVHPWLPAAQDNAPQADAFRALHAALAGQDPSPSAAASLTLQQTFRALLGGMIGESLTRHLLDAVVPDPTGPPPPQGNT